MYTYGYSYTFMKLAYYSDKETFLSTKNNNAYLIDEMNIFADSTLWNSTYSFAGSALNIRPFRHPQNVNKNTKKKNLQKGKWKNKFV